MEGEPTSARNASSSGVEPSAQITEASLSKGPQKSQVEACPSRCRSSASETRPAATSYQISSGGHCGVDWLGLF